MEVFASLIRRRSFGTTMSVSTCSRAASPSPPRARGGVLEPEGFAATATGAPMSLAIFATISYAPVPFIAESATNTMSAPSSDSAMRPWSSAAAERPTSGFARRRGRG